MTCNPIEDTSGRSDHPTRASMRRSESEGKRGPAEGLPVQRTRGPGFPARHLIRSASVPTGSPTAAPARASRATRSNRSSRPQAATSWIPTGSPSGVRPAGTLIAGCPVTFHAPGSQPSRRRIPSRSAGDGSTGARRCGSTAAPTPASAGDRSRRTSRPTAATRRRAPRAPRRSEVPSTARPAITVIRLRGSSSSRAISRPRRRDHAASSAARHAATTIPC